MSTFEKQNKKEFIVEIKSEDIKNAKGNDFLMFLDKSRFYKELWSIALPIYFQMLSSTILILINSLLLRWYEGGAYFSTIWKANNVYSWLMFLPSFSAAGVFVAIGNLLGKQKSDDLCKPIVIGWIFNVSLAVIIILVILPLKNYAFDWLHVSKSEYKLASTVYIVNLFAILLNAVNVVCQRSESALGNTKLLFVVILIGDCANTIVAYLLVWLSPLKASGVAYAQLVAYLIQIVLLLYFMSRHFHLKKIFYNFKLCFDKPIFRQIVMIGIPTALEALAANLTGFFMSNYITAASIKYGDNDALLNVHTAVNQIVNFGLLMSAALGQTASIFISRMIGAKLHDYAILISNRFWHLTLYISIPVTIVMTALAWPLLKIYNIDSNVIWQLGIFMFAINIFQEIGRTMNQVGLSCLRSANYTFVPLYYGMASLLVINVGLMSGVYYLLQDSPRAFILTLWGILGLEEIIRGAAYMILWKRKFWFKSVIKMQGGHSK